MTTQQLVEQNLPRLSDYPDGQTVPKLYKASSGNDGLESLQARRAPDHIIFRGQGFKTQFYGASHHWYPVGVLSNIQDVHRYFREVLEQEPVLASLARNIPSLRQATKEAEHAERESNAPVNLPLLLPDRATCQDLMELYFKYTGCIYSIIHRPTFWHQFSEYWVGGLKEPLPFLAVMLAAMSCSRCMRLDDVARYEGASSAGREQATTWLNAVEKWLSQQSHKHTTIVTFQIPCLLLEARRTNSIKIKRQYTKAQSLVSDALAAGFHRDPAELGPKTTPFDREMRRRIWSSILEYELGAAVARGLLALSPNLPTSCLSAANVGDEDLVPGQEVKHVQPDSVFTESSYLRFADKTRALRNEINNLVNDPRRHVTLPYSAVLDYHSQLTACLSDIPSWTTAARGVRADSSGIAKGMAGLKLRKMLFLLHLPFAAQQSVDPSVKHSRFVCHEVAYDILQIHKEASADGIVCPLVYTRSDVVRAGISICLMKLDRPQVQDATLLEMQRRFQIDQMDRLLELVEARVLRLGVGFKGYWMLLAASCFEEAMQEGPTSTTWRARVVDRCASLYYKLASAQPPRAPAGSAGAENSVSGSLACRSRQLKHDGEKGYTDDHQSSLGAKNSNTSEVLSDRIGMQVRFQHHFRKKVRIS